jgi:uncharacterized protein
MSIKEELQQAIKEAVKSRDELRKECLRMAKGAVLMKEKESAKDEVLSEEAVIQVLRTEVKKRQQSSETFREVGKTEEADKSLAEAAIIEEFLPSQLSEAQLEEKVRAYLEAHPDVNHAGKLTGAMKKELGDQADGKVLNQVCRKALEG